MALTSKVIKKRYRDKRAKAAVLWLSCNKTLRNCCDCHTSYDEVVLEFDHVPGRGKKLFEIGQCRDKVSLDGQPSQKLLDEVDKCDLVCCNCHSERTFQRNCISKRPLSNNEKYIRQYKINNNICTKCKNKLKWYQLQFNHIDPSQKTFQVSRPSNRTLDEVKLEITKCEILCGNCHAFVTHYGR